MQIVFFSLKYVAQTNKPHALSLVEKIIRPTPFTLSVKVCVFFPELMTELASNKCTVSLCPHLWELSLELVLKTLTKKFLTHLHPLINQSVKAMLPRDLGLGVSFSLILSLKTSHRYETFRASNLASLFSQGRKTVE